MITIKIQNPNRIFLNSYRPICYTKFGVCAIQKFGLDPFIDASCRREPDFENSYPSITALCRGRVFAPRLKRYDVIVYITQGSILKPYKKGHHFVAILQVEDIYSTHLQASSTYQKIPHNCMVACNPPLPFEKTAGDFPSKEILKRYLSITGKKQKRIGDAIIKNWDAHYRDRCNRNSVFVKTKPLYLNIKTPQLILPENFKRIFGKTPNTRIPLIIEGEKLKDLASEVDIEIVFN